MALLWFIKCSISHVLPLSAKKLPTALDVLSTNERYDLYCSAKVPAMEPKFETSQTTSLPKQHLTELFHAIVCSLLNIVVLMFVYHVIHIIDILAYSVFTQSKECCCCYE
jgi:hypothetical protein